MIVNNKSMKYSVINKYMKGVSMKIKTTQDTIGDNNIKLIDRTTNEGSNNGYSDTNPNANEEV